MRRRLLPARLQGQHSHGGEHDANAHGEDSWLEGALAALTALLCLSLVAIVTADGHHGKGKDKRDRFLYIWAGDQARLAPDFPAVINFDEESDDYGHVIKTVPIPPPGNVGNEPHPCHLSANKKILACGGLLSVLRDQNGIFFFDVSKADDPKVLFSTRAPQSSITDDFLPLEKVGFLVTQMGSASGDAPGRVAEFDKRLRLVREWPDNPPTDGFNPHGISARPDLNLNEDDFGKIHFEGDHKVHVVKVFRDRLELDPRFQLDFNTAFPTGPARPHGIEMK